MRLPKIAARDQRALVSGAGVIAAIVLITRVVPTLRAWNAASVVSAREVVGEAYRAEQSVADSTALRDSLRARQTRFMQVRSILLAGSSVASAGATLAELVSDAAEDAGTKLGALQLRSDTAAGVASRGMFIRVSVHADLTADVRGLSSFLLALEEGPTLLAIRELSVTQPELGVPAGRPEMLRVEVVVEGLALGDAGGMR